MTGRSTFGWFGIARIGCVEAAIGANIVLATSLFNRVMVVELGLAASIPGALVALHYLLQLLRPRWGHGADQAPHASRWIIGGMGALSFGTILAACAMPVIAADRAAGLALAAAAFAMIGIGVGAAGTSALALLAARVADRDRAAAGSVVWIMMIAGFVIASGVSGAMIAPFSFARLIAAVATISLIALAIATLAVVGLGRAAPTAEPSEKPRFADALRIVLADKDARRFTWFIGLSMIAYGAQDLILEPFGGIALGLSPGATTTISSLQNGAALIGMVFVAIGARWFARDAAGQARVTRLACVGSAIALAAVAFAGASMPPLFRPAVGMLGFANGVFAGSAIGLMMTLARGRDAGLKLGVWGAAQAIAMGGAGVAGTIAVDLSGRLIGGGTVAYCVVFVMEAVLFGSIALFRLPRPHPAELAAAPLPSETYDVVVVGGGPAGATAATDLAAAGRRVLLLDRAGRIKPCGGAIPPRLIRDFAIPDDLLCAHVASARVVAPSGRQVRMPIDGGYVGMVDRDAFDEWLRVRAGEAGATRRTGRFLGLGERRDGMVTVRYEAERGGEERCIAARVVIGADGANSAVAREALPNQRTRHVFAYHEIVKSPPAPTAADFTPDQCDVVYRGALSPDFYAWVFPHGATTSIGVGSAHKGFALRDAVATLRAETGLDACDTVRHEGAPIPLKPLGRWDDGRNVLVVGDAAGVVAPASGEGIYYAMASGRMGAKAAGAALATGDMRHLATARRAFMAQHGKVFRVLGLLQAVWYRNDWLRERFVALCRDPDVQRLTWQAYMNKEMVRAQHSAHLRLFVVNIANVVRGWVTRTRPAMPSKTMATALPAEG